MPAYITELSGNDFEVLEEIFVDKYNKFIHLYWLYFKERVVMFRKQPENYWKQMLVRRKY